SFTPSSSSRTSGRSRVSTPGIRAAPIVTFSPGTPSSVMLMVCAVYRPASSVLSLYAYPTDGPGSPTVCGARPRTPSLMLSPNAMNRVALIRGGAVTTMANEQLSVRFSASVTLQVTLVDPIGKIEGLGGVHV